MFEDSPKWQKVMERSEKRMYKIIVDAKEGERIIYHTGNLSKDCAIGQKKDVAEAIGRRSAVQVALEKGLCLLYQRRCEEGFDYIAQKLKV